MTKTELLNQIAAITSGAIDAKVSRKAAGEIYEGIISTIIKAVKKEGQCKLPDFGIVKIVQSKARMGRNPATGETIQIKAKTRVKIRVAKALRVALVGK